MSAEILREAAALMRSRAEIATQGRWLDCLVQMPGGDIHNAIGTDRDVEYEVCSLIRTPQASMDAEHIASWHPNVALAVADWLEADATVIERHNLDASVSKAFLVARAYLGRDA